MVTQPLLYVPPEIEVGLLDGSFKLFGSIVRDRDTDQIVKHLENAVPAPDQVERVVRKLSSKIVVAMAAGAVVLGRATTYIVRRRRKAWNADIETRSAAGVVKFESSLHHYVEAGRTGALTTDIVVHLFTDLDEIKAFSEVGSDVRISLDALVPLFDLVIARTSRLAEPSHVVMADLSDDESHDSVVISLRRHLDVQKTILGAIA